MKLVLTNNEIVATANAVGNIPFIKKIITSNDKIVDEFYNRLSNEFEHTKAAYVLKEKDSITIKIEEEFVIDLLQLSGGLIAGLFQLVMNLQPAAEKIGKKWYNPSSPELDPNVRAMYKTTVNRHLSDTFLKATPLVIEDKLVCGLIITGQGIITIPSYIKDSDKKCYYVKVDQHDKLIASEECCEWKWLREDWTAQDSLPLGDRKFFFFENEDDMKNFVINWQ